MIPRQPVPFSHDLLRGRYRVHYREHWLYCQRRCTGRYLRQQRYHGRYNEHYPLEVTHHPAASLKPG